MNRTTLEQQSAWLAERKRQLGLSGRGYREFRCTPHPCEAGAS